MMMIVKTVKKYAQLMMFSFRIGIFIGQTRFIHLISQKHHNHINLFYLLINKQKATVRRMNEIGLRLNDYQMMNHFPNHWELTRKGFVKIRNGLFFIQLTRTDTLMKNVKRFRREMERENNPLAVRDANGVSIYLNVIPMSYMLPQDYAIFAEEFKRSPNQVWIVKPAAGSQGNGIFLVRTLKVCN